MNPEKSPSTLSGRPLARRAVPTVVSLLLCAAGMAEAVTFRYYRFQALRLASGGVQEQLSEFELLKSGVKVPYPALTVATAINAGADGGGETPTQAIDANTATKWFNFGNGAFGPPTLQLDLGVTPPDIDGYRFATANDSLDRTPVSWRMSGSNDLTTWTTLDIKRDQAAPTALFTFSPDYVFPDPSTIEPEFTTFSLSAQIVLNGKKPVLTYVADRATAVHADPEPAGDLPGSGTVNLNPAINADTPYIFYADNAAGFTPDKTFTVRSVAGATLSYEYVRFTPVKMPSNTAAIQLAEITFKTVTADGTVTATVPPTAVQSVLYDTGTTPATGEIPANLADGLPATKWFSGSLRPIVFRFNGQQTFNRYSFTMAADAGTYPNRNPVQWRMEGKNGANGAWKAIESIDTFDHPTPSVNGAVTVDIPFPGNSVPLTLADFYATRDPEVAGTPTILHWTVAGEQTLTLKVGNAAPVNVAGGNLTVTPPAPNTLYTLRATSALDPSADPIELSLTLSPAQTTVPAAPNLTDFGIAGPSLVLNGSAALLNDYPKLIGAGDKMRLSVVPDLTGVTGSAWFVNKVPLSGGFDTTFDMVMATKDRGYGAEGLAFSIQNSVEGTLNLPADAERGPLTNALTIKFSSWNNGQAPPNQAKIALYRDSVEVPGGEVDLLPLIEEHGTGYATLTGNYASAPYAVRIAWASGKLNIWIDGIQVMTDFAIDLGTAVDAEGKGYVGFLSRGGGLSQYSDLTSWVLTPGTVVAPVELKILSYSFNFSTSMLTVEFASTSGKTYTVTGSSTLTGPWLPVGLPATASSATTTITVPFIKGSKDFFRVETP